jgi:drug/metabolite transporter (DMT)-like permease
MRGVIYYIGLSACMVTEATVVHYLGHKVSVEQLTLVRGIGTAAFVAALSRRDVLVVFRTGLFKMHVCRALLTLLSFWAIFYALGHLLLADAAAINYARALFMTVCGVLWFGEVVSRWRWLAIAVSYIGSLIVIGPSFVHWNPVYLIALAGAALNAAAMTGSKYLTRIDGQVTTLAYTAAVMLLCSLPAIAEPWPIEQSGLLALLGVAGGLGMLFSQLAVLHADMSLLAPYDYLRLPLIISIGLLLFDERLSFATAGGVTLILASGLLLWRKEIAQRATLPAAQATRPTDAKDWHVRPYPSLRLRTYRSGAR